MKRKKMKNRILVSMYEGVEAPQWFDNIEPFMQYIMKKLHFNHEEVSVMFCNDAYIQELNKQYRQMTVQQMFFLLKTMMFIKMKKESGSASATL